MRLAVKETAALNSDEAQALRALNAAVYPPRPGSANQGPQLKWARPKWSILLWNEENQLVTYAGALARLCSCDGCDTLIGGIGGVKTHPQQRGQGYAGAAIRRATEFLCTARRVDFLLLFCREELLTYYNRLGFSLFAGDTWIMQDGVKTIFTWNETMVMPGLKASPKCKALDLRGLPW